MVNLLMQDGEIWILFNLFIMLMDTMFFLQLYGINRENFMTSEKVENFTMVFQF